MKKFVLKIILICLLLSLSGCSADKRTSPSDDRTSDSEGMEVHPEGVENQKEEVTDAMQIDISQGESYTKNSKIAEVIREPLFGDYGRLLFPVDSGYYSGETLGKLGLTWYSNIDPEKTVEIVNYMKDRASAGGTHFL